MGKKKKQTSEEKKQGTKQKEEEKKSKEEEKDRTPTIKPEEKNLEKEIKTELISNGFHESFGIDFFNSKVVLEKVNDIQEINFQEDIVGISTPPASRDNSRIYTSNSPQYTSENINQKIEEVKYSTDFSQIVLTPTNFNQPRFELPNLPREISGNMVLPQIRPEVEVQRKKLPFEMREEKYKRTRI